MKTIGIGIIVILLVFFIVKTIVNCFKELKLTIGKMKWK